MKKKKSKKIRKNKKLGKKINKKSEKLIKNKKLKRKINKRQVKKINKKYKKQIDEKLKKLKKNQELAFRVDLRKLSKYQREFVKRIREGYKQNQWKKKLMKYIAISLLEYYKIFNQPDLIRNLPKQIGVSRNTFRKIVKGIKVSKKTYKKFNEFLSKKLNNYETAFLFVISEHVKKARGKISQKTVQKVVNEIYEFMTYEVYKGISEMNYYDYLKLFYN